MKRKSLLSIIVVLLIVSLLSGCSSSNNDDGDVLIVGLDDTFAPMGFKDDDGGLIGFDIDLAKEISERTRLQFEFQNIDWDLKDTELENGSIDMIWNGYSITDKRKEKVLFGDSYMDNSQLIIILSSSDIDSKNDLSGKVLSVQKNSSAYEAVMRDEELVNSLDGQQVIQFDTNNDCFSDL